MQQCRSIIEERIEQCQAPAPRNRSDAFGGASAHPMRARPRALHERLHIGLFAARSGKRLNVEAAAELGPSPNGLGGSPRAAHASQSTMGLSPGLGAELVLNSFGRAELVRQTR